MHSPHRGHWRAVAWLFATLALASCASRPPARDADDSILGMRAQYLKSHPNGRFNEEINKGEVAPGMNFDDMLASWGIPDTRIRTGTDDRERWVYVVSDEYSHDWVRYDFVFANRELTRWEQMRNVASSQYIGSPGSSSTLRSLPPQPATSVVPGGSGAPRR
jgi:hypothetical protein